METIVTIVLVVAFIYWIICEEANWRGW